MPYQKEVPKLRLEAGIRPTGRRGWSLMGSFKMLKAYSKCVGQPCNPESFQQEVNKRGLLRGWQMFPSWHTAKFFLAASLQGWMTEFGKWEGRSASYFPAAKTPLSFVLLPYQKHPVDSVPPVRCFILNRCWFKSCDIWTALWEVL